MNHLSLLVNIILLAGFGLVIYFLMKTKKIQAEPVIDKKYDNAKEDVCDEIISVRKISADSVDDLDYSPKINKYENHTTKDLAQYNTKKHEISASSKILQKKIIFIITANNNNSFAGYELLQILLAAGFRFGDGQLFHRHQQSNGYGNVCFSLAAATSSGTFDLQNIGSLKIRGLCVFMHLTDDISWNNTCFDLMLETAKKLSEDLQANLLDDCNNPLDEIKLEDYRQRLYPEND